MTARKTKSVALVANSIVVPNYADMPRPELLAVLAKATVNDRRDILMTLPIGEIAAIGGKVLAIGKCAYEVIAHKMSVKHGADWVALSKAKPSELDDESKARRKAILQQLEAIRETVKSNGGSDDQARQYLHAVKQWGSGKRKSKTGANRKKSIVDWLTSPDVLPYMYKRMSKDELDAECEVFWDAVGALLEAKGLNLRVILAD